MKPINIGIIGCGTIGSALAGKITKQDDYAARLAYIFDIDKNCATDLHKKLSHGTRRRGTARCAPTAAALIHKSDFIIEAASASVSFDIAKSCLKKNKQVLIMSIGGLVEHVRELAALAKKSKGTLYLPSGAICGIDGVLAAHCGGITKVQLTTRKPIRGLQGAPFFTEKKIDLNTIREETVVFEGRAAEAIRYFPKNVNVAALLSLASLGVTQTTVRIITSPTLTRNSHEVMVEGAFGRLTTVTENVPSPTNPKTSYLAILAAEALLKKIFAPIKIGT